MIQFDQTACIGCGACVRDCFPHALSMAEGFPALSAPDACILCGHCIAVCPAAAVSMQGADMSEVIEGAASLDPDALLHQMQFRRSVRQYAAEPVTDEQVGRLLTAARWCPTAKNAQLTQYIVVREQKAALLGAALEALGNIGRTLLADPALPVDEARRAGNFVRWHEEFLADPVGTDPLFFHAPALILFVSGPDARDAAAAAAYAELQAAAMGLGCLYSGYFTAAAAESETIRSILSLGSDQQVARCLVVGHPAVHFRRTVPREPTKVRFC